VDFVNTESVDYQTIALDWDAVDGADGYIIYRALASSQEADLDSDETDADSDVTDTNSDGADSETQIIDFDAGGTGTALENLNYEEIAQVDTLSYQDSERVTGQDYAYRVQAYRVVKSSSDTKEKVVKGEMGSVAVSSTQLPETTITKITKKGSDSIELKLAAVDGADGYYIYRSTSADGEYTLIKDFTDLDSLTYTDTGLVSSTTYYYQAEAYCKVEASVQNTDTDSSDVVDFDDTTSQDENSSVDTDGLGVVTSQLSNTANATTDKAPTVNYSGSSYTFTGDTSNKIVQLAASKLGCAYVWGASGPNKFDCSGLVIWVYKNAGCTYSIPHHAQSIYNKFLHVSKENLQVGDLVFYGGSASSINHVAIYVGGNKVIHAANPKSGVKVSSISSAGSKIVGYVHIPFTAK
jgi:cell wall-associated NlpC family hydrolase